MRFAFCKTAERRQFERRVHDRHARKDFLAGALNLEIEVHEVLERLLLEQFAEALFVARQTVSLEFVELLEEFARRLRRRVKGRLVRGPFVEKIRKLTERIGK